MIRNNTPVTLAIFWGLIWGPFFDEVNDRRLPLQLQRLQQDIPLHNKHDATSRTSVPTSENSVLAKFAFWGFSEVLSFVGAVP